MTNEIEEVVTGIKHWNDSLFSITTTRRPTFTFENGQFVMMGIEVDGRRITRPYSIASANYESELEFFSIKVPQGALTSRLQHIKVGQKVLLSKKASGTLVAGLPDTWKTSIPARHWDWTSPFFEYREGSWDL